MNALRDGSIAGHLFIPKCEFRLSQLDQRKTWKQLTRAGTAAGLGQAQSGDTWSIKRPVGGSSHSEEQFKLFMMADGP